MKTLGFLRVAVLTSVLTLGSSAILFLLARTFPNLAFLAALALGCLTFVFLVALILNVMNYLRARKGDEVENIKAALWLIPACLLIEAVLVFGNKYPYIFTHTALSVDSFSLVGKSEELRIDIHRKRGSRDEFMIVVREKEIGETFGIEKATLSSDVFPTIVCQGSGKWWGDALPYGSLDVNKLFSTATRVGCPFSVHRTDAKPITIHITADYVVAKSTLDLRFWNYYGSDQFQLVILNGIE